MALKKSVPARYVLVLFIFLTSMVLKSQRAMMNVAILSMVNHSAIFIMQNETHSDECPGGNEENVTYTYMEGTHVWTQSTQGIILGSYFYGYVFAQVVGGYVTFLLGPKNVFIATALISSIFVLLTPTTTNYGVAIVSLVQTIIGLSQGLFYPASYTILARWSPVNEKSRFVSICASGNQVGSITGMIVTGYLCQYGFAGGWPSSFYVFGTYGIFISLLLWFVVYERPQEHPRISSTELMHLEENVSNLSSRETKLRIPWKKILLSRVLWVIAVTKICWGCGFYTLLAKLPSYLKIMLHFPIQQNGLINALVYFSDAITIFLSGFIADFIRKRQYFSLTNTRKILESIGMFGPAFCILSVPFLGCDSTKAIISLTLAMGCFGFCTSGDAAIVFDLAPDFAGVLYGITSGLASIPGFITPYIAGLILDKNQGSLLQWSYVFYMGSSFYFVGGIVFIVGASAELQSWAIQSPNKDEKN
ncbi:sialin-like [Centruroides sculpturatus]|uniref:sialin-like n=2 Tax=Centruroides sculpturatus TaxID=218467 RepID=UPI000C6F00F2|nr:sialin-like [Centruroides sculpturatus]